MKVRTRIPNKNPGSDHCMFTQVSTWDDDDNYVPTPEMRRTVYYDTMEHWLETAGDPWKTGD
jgi:hypothetical protein